MQSFTPLLANPHALTIAAHYWPRRLDVRRYPVTSRIYRTAPDASVLVEEQRPRGAPLGELILVHGLESSSRVGYMRGMAQAALEAGYVVHRLNLRGCGGTEALSETFYHSGLTTDLRCVAESLAGPVFVIGYSLGGNVVLKLAGELGEKARGLVAGVCAVSTPIDLAACVRRLGQPENRLYERRFVRRMRRRLEVRHHLMPDHFPIDGLASVRSVFEFDNRFTAQAFGFRDAAHYYETQSAARFLPAIRVPTLLVQAKDDPLIPFDIFTRAGLEENPWLRLLATEHGGHLGFVARRPPRFWLEGALLNWIGETRNKTAAPLVSS